MKWLAALIGGAALLAAGAGIASPTSAAKAPCSPHPSASKRVGPILRADVDGDGTADRITMRARRGSICRWLVVHTARRTYFKLVLPEIAPFKAFLAVAVRLTARKSQIVVVRDEGAATLGVTLYGIPSKRLAGLPFENLDSTSDELSLNGSVDQWSGAACRQGGLLKVFGFGRPGKRAFYSERAYRVQGGLFRLRILRAVRATRPPRWWRRSTAEPNFKGCVTSGNPHRLD